MRVVSGEGVMLIQRWFWLVGLMYLASESLSRLTVISPTFAFRMFR
jgi:hypothetical protein